MVAKKTSSMVCGTGKAFTLLPHTIQLPFGMTASTSTLRSLSAALLARQPAPPLSPSSVFDRDLSTQISACSEASEVTKAVLHLCNDDISNAHNLAQSHEESMTANLVHAILHRREGDYWNSVSSDVPTCALCNGAEPVSQKWWLSRIEHPTITSTHGSIRAAKKFVDDVEKAESRLDVKDGGEQLRERQWQELRALLDYALQENMAS